ncbi:hypothetical protein [Thermofilum sp.]|uniref:hypothetical protein n=1 Tax=Thermofilum sp. TaxID=1961369 RepID=UPI003169C718
MTEPVEGSPKQALEDEKLRLWVKENVVKHGVVAYVLNQLGSVSRAANYVRIYGKARIGIAVNTMSLSSESGVDLDGVLGAPSGELSVKGGGRPRATGARVKNGCSRSYCRSWVSDCKSLDRTVLVEWFTS